MKCLLLVYSLTDCVTLFGLCCGNVTVLPGFSNYTHDGMMNNDGHICITMTQFVIKILSEVTGQNIEDKRVFCLTLSGQWQWPYVLDKTNKNQMWGSLSLVVNLSKPTFSSLNCSSMVAPFFIHLLCLLTTAKYE